MIIASKVFIYIGMILQFFLIYPIVIGVKALKTIDRATNKSDLNRIAIASIFFCSFMGGIFMLLIDEYDLQKLDEKRTKNKYNKLSLIENHELSDKSKKDIFLVVINNIIIIIDFITVLIWGYYLLYIFLLIDILTLFFILSKSFNKYNKNFRFLKTIVLLYSIIRVLITIYRIIYDSIVYINYNSYYYDEFLINIILMILFTIIIVNLIVRYKDEKIFKN